MASANASDDPKEQSSFIGVVQHLKGQGRWQRRPDHSLKEKLQFKSFFHLNDVATLDDNSHLKLISQSRCKAVIYGPAGIAAPTQTTTPVWTIKAKAMRWLCPEGARENLKLNERRLQVQAGEVLYKDGQLFVLSGRILSPSGVLQSNTVYSYNESKWNAVRTMEKDSYFLWSLHNSLPLPKESLQLKKPKIPIRSRWTFGPIGGGGSVQHDNEIVSGDDYGWSGLRLGSNFLWKDKSIIATLTWLEMEPEEDTESGPTGPQPGQIFNYTRSQIFSADLGLRLYHERSWSPYFKVGLAHESLEIDFNGNMGGFYFGTRRIQELINTTITAGIDKTFFTDWLGWGGLYLSAEAFYQLTLLKGGESVRDEYSDNTNQSRLNGLSSGVQRYGVLFHVGGMLTF